MGEVGPRLREISGILSSLQSYNVGIPSQLSAIPPVCLHSFHTSGLIYSKISSSP